MDTRKRASSLLSLTPPRVTRSTTSAQECLSPVNPTKFPRRSIRTNGPITCCDFGLDRVQKFPNGDFCHPCKMWDDRDVIASHRASRTSKQYKCVRIHQSLSSPQRKDSKWWLCIARKKAMRPLVCSPVQSYLAYHLDHLVQSLISQNKEK